MSTLSSTQTTHFESAREDNDLVARFANEIHLPPPATLFAKDAADAIRQEYRRATRLLKLHCRSVTPIQGEAETRLFILEVGHAIEFDWSTEGARAFRPADFGLFDVAPDVIDQTFGAADDAGGEAVAWQGVVVEVDEAHGRISVAVSDSQRPPHRGVFLIRPFEFLACLDDLYGRREETGLAELLNARLAACRGGVHPRVTNAAENCLPELVAFWNYAWSVLWGPPGTGKTTLLGRQVIAALNDPVERVLVVSTTNRATDEAALSIGRALQKSSLSLSGQLLRIGKGATYAAFDNEGLLDLLRGTETEILHEIGQLNQVLAGTVEHEPRTMIRHKVHQRILAMRDVANEAFVSPNVRVVVATAFKATTFVNSDAIRNDIARGLSPFTTVFIDEAGLISRAAMAALSLLAARRVVIVGDGKQLAPISKISRVHPTSQANWLRSSALTHLDRTDQASDRVHLLSEQHRMHPEISRVVSSYQYDGALRDGDTVLNRPFPVPAILADAPRAMWYVLDEEEEPVLIRAERGPGNRSWIRKATSAVLAKLFRDDGLRVAKGLFVSPFKAQARRIGRYFAEEGITSWNAATVHSQQGVGVDIVIFDTVNAGSTCWLPDVWIRLVNVAISRAREFVLVLASRAEMTQPYLQPLLAHLQPRILRRSGRRFVWSEVPVERSFVVPATIADDPSKLGPQFKKRKLLRTVMSADQQRLCGFKMDGGPRLVRGVAGSGKTLVLAHWLQKTIETWQDRPDAKAWAVFSNRALRHLLERTIAEAWAEAKPGHAVPWGRMELWHIRDVLRPLLADVGEQLVWGDFEWNDAAGRLLAAKPLSQIQPRCHAMFIDEAQDFGPKTLEVLAALVEPNDPADPKSRAVNIFYDDAQNIYGRPRPVWSTLGLNMLGRSTVMKESFRSTKPITEFALNVLDMLQKPGTDGDRKHDEDHKELVKNGLLEETSKRGQPWWNVRFSQIDGPRPVFKSFGDHGQLFAAVRNKIAQLVRDEGVVPKDICVIVAQRWFGNRLLASIGKHWQSLGIRASFATDNPTNLAPDTVVICTPHSFKGYDAEVVFIAGVEQFIVGPNILANNLYVAMTRARSMLFVYGWSRPGMLDEQLFRVLNHCQECLEVDPQATAAPTRLDDFHDILETLGEEHRDWLREIWNHHALHEERLVAADGEILAEPLFWFEQDGRRVACFGKESPGPATRNRLEDVGIRIVMPGD